MSESRIGTTGGASEASQQNPSSVMDMDGPIECQRVNGHGVTYTEFSCMYPLLGKTYFDFENNFDITILRDWMRPKPLLPCFIVAFYLAAVYLGRAYFRDRPAWNLRGSLAVWNFCLSLFSFIGFIRTFPYIAHNMYYYPWRTFFCVDPETHFGSGATGLWGQLFALSKIPELIDTFFIVVHKKPLMFLHWYHHISVLLFCWYSYLYNSPTGIIFCAMNYAVHAMMYCYYFLMAVRMKPKWFNPIWITLAQISQMFVGVTITAMGWYLLEYEKPEKCTLTKENNMAAMVMYGSYLFLFMQFFVGRYFFKDKKKSSKKSKKA